MLILTLRTDKPDAELGLYEDNSQVAYEVCAAHRQLGETLHYKITELLASQHKALQDIEAIICFKGPGSFTGLRIGVSVANALADGLTIPVVGIAEETDWIDRGLSRIMAKENDKIVIPEYGAPVHITLPKK